LGYSTQFGNRYEKFWADKPLVGLNEAEQFELFQKLFRREKKELAHAYYALGDYEKAITYNQQHLAIVQSKLQQLMRSRSN
jgi:hypothetical protein